MRNNYTTAPQVTDISTSDSGTSIKARFVQDVKAGLSQPHKVLSSRYFYDGEGSRLFQKIMHLPEYYLTNCEHNVFSTHRQTIAAQLAAQSNFHLIDLGAGDATKTKIILRELLAQQADFDYVPVDISGDAITGLCEKLQHELPDLHTHAVVGDYFDALDWLDANKPSRKVLLFLGSNIGNFSPDERIAFLKKVRSHMQPGDMLLVGIDLCKKPETILSAYNDSGGVTAAFNLNLLHRINLELGGNFAVDQFRHFAMYDPQEGVMKSYLISQQDQEVLIQATKQSYQFKAWEAIHTESSYKFTLEQADILGKEAGFEVQHIFQDKNHYFADVLYAVT